MAYDKGLARQVQKLLENRPTLREKKMFGGVCYLLNGNMVCGILNQDLIVRVGPQHYADTLKLPYTRPFDITGRPMKGWVMVSEEGLKTRKDLASWLDRAIAFVLTLPSK